MRAVGIIAEYNPLHNGHLYHLEESKKLAGADAVVVAMSGNFCQRGEPAILDKWERARLAVQGGADVVVEIPALFCLGNSSQYAHAGVKLLDSIGLVTHFAFGSETGNIDTLKIVSDNLISNRKSIEEKIAKLVKTQGFSYPRAREITYEQLFGNDNLSVFSSSNDNLALSYLQVPSSMEPIAIKRVGADYTDALNDNCEYQSATGIREAVNSAIDIAKYVPDYVKTSLDSNITTNPEEWLNCLKYAVMSMTLEEIDNCPSGGEGLGNKIKSSINGATSFDEFVKSIKSKRYTYSRISRLFMQILLGINRDDYAYDPQYIRILALSNNGRKLISCAEKDETIKLPIITNINKQKNSISAEGLKQLNLDIHASDVYNLVTGRDQEKCSDYKTKPSIQE